MATPIHVVIIDDDHALCYLLTKALASPEFSVSVAHSAMSGVDLVLRLKPDVVLLDIELPDCNGFVALAQLKRQNVPAKIVMSSALTAVLWRYRAREAGVDAILPKPYSLSDLLRTIKEEVSEDRSDL